MPGEEGFETDSSALRVLNGRVLNGAVLNGAVLNGRVLNGRVLNGAALNGRVLNGSMLTGTSSSGAVIEGEAMVGSRWTGRLDDGTSIELRIDAMFHGPDPEIYRYLVSHETAYGWRSICGYYLDGAPVTAIPISGRFDHREGVAGGGSYIDDPNAITFGCVTGAIGKCVLYGYKPWAPLPSGTGTMRDHHVGCTRLVRADYCGDGRSWTLTGTPINIYDNAGVQLDTENWDAEAEWNANGATCISSKADARFRLLNVPPPSCFRPLRTRTCGTSFGNGSLLIDEHQETTATGVTTYQVTGDVAYLTGERLPASFSFNTIFGRR